MAAKKSRKTSPKKKSAPKKKGAAKKRTVVKKKAAKKPAGTTKKRATRRKANTSSETDARVGQIKRLIDVMVAAGAVEVELKEANTKLRVRLKDDSPVVSYAAPPMPAPGVPATHAPLPAAAPAVPEEAAPAAEEAKGDVFTSPMVGSFYASPSPDTDPFVRVGDRVEADTTLCILEAMKVMNEIKAEMSGVITEVLVQNGQPVEFGQPLFVIQAG